MPATQEDRLYGLTTSVAVKPAVAISSDYNITLFGEQTITSSTFTGERTVTTTTGMRVLVMGQSSPIDNGIWIASPATWHRAPDFDGARDAVNGTLVFSIYGDCWQLEAADPVQIGYSALEFRSTYPFNGGLNEFQRSLRVPETSVNILPQISGRANHLLAFNNDGQPVMVLPESGSAADVLLDLASSVDGKGDALVAVKQPFTGSAAITQHDKNGQILHVKDFGAVGDGIVDDTASFINALSAFSIFGGTLHVGNGKYLVGSFTIPAGVTILGDNYQPYEVDVGKSYYDCGGQFRCKSGTTITLLRGTGVVNLLIIKDGLPSVITTNAHAATAIAAFKDKAFTSISPDIYFDNVLVLGFEYAFYSNPTIPNVGRRTFVNFRGDCTNGIYANYGLDVDRLSGCHFWPYLTAHIAEATTTANLQRSGKAYYFGNVADWTEFSNCFSYGYDAHIHIDNGYSVKIRGGGGDACGSVAVLITGASRFVYVEGISTNSFHLGLSVATTGSEPEVRSINNNWAAVEQGIYVTSGTLISTSDHFSQGSVGVSFSDGTVLGILNSPHFSGVTLPWSNTALSAPKVYVNNPSYGATQIWSTSAVREKAVSSSIYDPRAATGGTGAALELGGNNNGGQIGQFRVQPRLTNATVGSTLSDVYYSIYANSAYIDRWVMQGDGTFRPGADGTQAVGSPTFRCGTIYSSSGTINTSDERAKEDIRPIEDKVLDAWAKVEFLSFKYKDSIKDKGESKSRIHFGVIAQRVKEAFESEELDPFEYGVLCYDEWEAVPGFIDEVNGVNQEAISAGNRYGIRYEEALILECALMRRSLEKITSAA